VATAYDISADGKIDRTKETEFKIDTALLSLTKSAMRAFTLKYFMRSKRGE